MQIKRVCQDQQCKAIRKIKFLKKKSADGDGEHFTKLGGR